MTKETKSKIKRLYLKLRLKLRRKKPKLKAHKGEYDTLTPSLQWREEQAKIAENKSLKALEDTLTIYNIQIQLGKDKEGKERMYYYYDVPHYTIKGKVIAMELEGEDIISLYDIVKITEVNKSKVAE
jgi:hypothetical protein